MPNAPKPIAPPDPAGLDQLLLAAGKGVARWLEGVVSAKLQAPVNIWDGQNGLGAVLAEQLQAANVPNQRLPELLTPRLVAQYAGVNPPRKRRLTSRYCSRCSKTVNVTKVGSGSFCQLCGSEFSSGVR
jgi:hypothetical protein